MRSTNQVPVVRQDQDEKDRAAINSHQLRECGIYEAPDGRKFVASRFRRTTAKGNRIESLTGSNSDYFLFTQYHWVFHGEPEFEITSNGLLLARKTPATWMISELVDTGFTAGAHYCHEP